jgi:hypothetical protein
MSDHLQDTAHRWVLNALAVRWRDPPGDALSNGDSDVPWEAVKAVALRHRVAGPLYDRTISHPGLFPEHITRWLRLVHSARCLRWGRRSDEVGRLLNALAAARVAVLLVKGWALAAVLYGGEMGRRIAKDLDIVVEPSQAERCRQVLARLGYLRPDSPGLWPGFDSRYRGSSYRSPAGRPRLLLDVHERPWKCSSRPNVLLDMLKRAQPVRIGGAGALAPAAEDHLLCLCAHLTRNHLRDNLAFRYHDLAELIHSKGQEFDWEAVLRRAVDWGLVVDLQWVLGELVGLWPEAVPASVLSDLSKVPRRLWQRLALRLLRHPVGADQGQFMALLAAPRFRKFRFILEMVFPSPAYMRWRYRTGSRGPLPLAYLKRLTMGLSRLFS